MSEHFHHSFDGSSAAPEQWPPQAGNGLSPVGEREDEVAEEAPAVAGQPHADAPPVNEPTPDAPGLSGAHPDARGPTGAHPDAPGLSGAHPDAPGPTGAHPDAPGPTPSIASAQIFNAAPSIPASQPFSASPSIADSPSVPAPPSIADSSSVSVAPSVDRPEPISESSPVPQPADPDSWNGVTRPRGRGGSSRFLTDVLVELGFIEQDGVQRAVEEARSSGVAPERVLVDRGWISAEQLSKAIAERYGIDHLDLGVFEADMRAVNLLSASAAKRYGAVPVAFLDDHTLLLAMSDPANVLAFDDIALITHMDLKPAVASTEDIAAVIGRMNRFEEAVQEAMHEDEQGAGPVEIVDLQESAEDAPVIKLVHSIIAQATERSASDIHFEPQADEKGGTSSEMRVRMRVDGVLIDTATVPRRMVGGVVSRIKIMSDLDISERRLPQDGRVSLTVEGHHVDVRVVTIPSVHGESVVLRILDKEAIRLELDKLGFQDQELNRFRRAFNRAHGGVLVTGPTGSGKSTTLYGALVELNTPEKHIITIEDPVEYQIPGITQVQIAPKAGLTFATGLRSMMRADPDILMVGEIRDRETAHIAIEGALTGHMVLSTLHTNDAPSAVTRLIEMGIEPFLVASAIDCVVAQRLVRMLCPQCKRRTIIPADILRDHGFHAQFDLEAYEPVGCVRCIGGYRGRVGLYEVMDLSEEIRNLTLERASSDQVTAVAVREGMRRLRDDGLEKVKAGLTSMAEVSRVTGGV